MKAIIAEVNYYKLTFKIIESLKTNNKTCSLCLWFMIYISSGADHTPLTSEDEPQKVIIRIFYSVQHLSSLIDRRLVQIEEIKCSNVKMTGDMWICFNIRICIFPLLIIFSRL